MISADLLRHFDVSPDELTIVHQGVNADVYRYGNRALKIFRNPLPRARNEYNVLRFLNGRFDTPLAHDFYTSVSSALSIDWIQGQRLADVPHLAPDVMSLVGENIARAHELTCGVETEIKNTNDPLEFYERLRRIARAVSSPVKLSQDGLAWIESHLDWVSDVRGLVHRDLKMENLVVTSDSVSILDWEFAGYYPPAWEFAKVRSGLYFTPNAIRAFEEGYQGVRPIPNEDEITFFSVFEFYTAWASTSSDRIPDLTAGGVLQDLLRDHGG